jgi:hypothetical protein
MRKQFKAELNGDESRADASASFTLPFDPRDVWGKAKVPVKVGDSPTGVGVSIP